MGVEHGYFVKGRFASKARVGEHYVRKMWWKERSGHQRVDFESRDATLEVMGGSMVYPMRLWGSLDSFPNYTVILR